MKKWKAWMIVIGIIGGIFYLSSIPGLRVLPILKEFNTFIMRFDVYFIRMAEIIAQRLPMDSNELTPFQTASNDFYVYAKANPVIIEFILRKIAHMVVFFCLTIAIFFLFNQYTKKSTTAVLFAFILTTVFAALDEFRQSFVDGRVSSLIDVFIDAIGITFATLLILFAIFITKKWSNEKGPLH
ncbi:VanZ family protein [Alkaliphilus metalliredigens QYMF]|uniref:VanZ family protein n=1 Tax=Alkaliphilus metalliredigens (strain QYMF) TaxID=293826 RepID=A6TLD3_ALKMQ|nr:VanZ family protein [Alkaliphilus metalliredigens]ABR47001.1 VanZ family protein [Alkaliphilus metalliredigens QYMF]